MTRTSSSSLAATDEQSVAQLPSLRAEISTPPGTVVQLTGYAPITVESAQQSEQDLQRAETVSLPLALVILIGVFGSVVAAGLPLLVAGLTIPTTLAFVYLLAQHTQMSVFVLNVSTMLGLALAIDYSLFLVSRFREELAPPDERSRRRWNRPSRRAGRPWRSPAIDRGDRALRG